MEHTYWHKQTSEPLFADILWSRPENKLHAGKLLIIGGNTHAFSAPAEAYQAAQEFGAGSVRFILPESLKKTIGGVLPECEFAPITRSGSFSKLALASWLEHAQWADAVLVAGDLGRNSETAVLLESFLTKYSGHVTLTKDSVEYFSSNPNEALAKRQKTMLVLTIAQLQKISRAMHTDIAFKFDTTAIELAENLHEFSKKFFGTLVIQHLDSIWVSHSGQVSSTTLQASPEIWRVRAATKAAIWQIQNQSKQFEAITAAFYEAN